MEPERGFIVAVLGSDVDADEELGEFRELSRTAGVEPVGEVVQKRSRPDQRTYVGKGKLAELSALVQECARRVAARRRRPDAGAAAEARRRAHGARRRPDPADPRHLRPACEERRGQAAGRARAARVQPPAHARHVAAPRAPRRRDGCRRRRGRHARPRREPARDRPPPRAAPDHDAQAAAEGAEQATGDSAQVA